MGSLKVLDQDQKSLSQLWSPTLVHYTSYKLSEISDTVAKLATLVLTTSRAPENSKLLAVRKKYEDKKMSRISKTLELTGESMEQLAAGNFLQIEPRLLSSICPRHFFSFSLVKS